MKKAFKVSPHSDEKGFIVIADSQNNYIASVQSKEDATLFVLSPLLVETVQVNAVLFQQILNDKTIVIHDKCKGALESALKTAKSIIAASNGN